jgi:hypothetical protein
MIAGTYNILCEQGTTFGRVLDLQYPDPVDPEIYYPFDLENFTARMQVRRTTDSTSTLVELTTANGRIVLGGAWSHTSRYGCFNYSINQHKRRV